MSVLSERNAWIAGRYVKGQPRGRLLCLAHAGGAASAYLTWRPHLPDGLEILPVQLPGREDRYQEPLLTGVPEMAQQAAEALAAELGPDLPYAIFGHSFGGLLGYELTRSLLRLGARGPQALLVSAAHPPQSSAGETVQSMPDAALLAQLVALGGVPEEVAEHPDFIRVMLRTARADLEAAERHQGAVTEPVPVPIHVFGSVDDPAVDFRQLSGWFEFTTGGSSLTLYQGGHFYLFAEPAALLADVVGRGLPTWVPYLVR